MKTYPEGTRWAVRRVVDGKRSIVVEPEPRTGCAAGATSWPTIAEAKRVLWTMRALWWGEDYRLVRIPPPRPKRSVEERIAAAVRERTEVILSLFTAPMTSEGSVYQRICNLRDGKVSA